MIADRSCSEVFATVNRSTEFGPISRSQLIAPLGASLPYPLMNGRDRTDDLFHAIFTGTDVDGDQERKATMPPIRS
jgi:hypothetical protein